MAGTSASSMARYSATLAVPFGRPAGLPDCPGWNFIDSDPVCFLHKQTATPMLRSLPGDRNLYAGPWSCRARLSKAAALEYRYILSSAERIMKRSVHPPFTQLQKGFTPRFNVSSRHL